MDVLLLCGLGNSDRGGVLIHGRWPALCRQKDPLKNLQWVVQNERANTRPGRNRPDLT